MVDILHLPNTCMFADISDNMMEFLYRNNFIVKILFIIHKTKK